MLYLLNSKQQNNNKIGFFHRSLIHADGYNKNTTHNHRFAIHQDPPGKDFYSWQNRCSSTKQIFNPSKVNSYKL